jgi:hypothetical protein
MQADASVAAAAGGRRVTVIKWTKPLKADVTGSASIGSAGGVIKLSSLNVTFTVPRGALTRTTTVTLTVKAGKYVVFAGGPSGTQFATPATLTMSLAKTTAGGKAALRGTLLGGYIDSPTQIGSDDTVTDSEDNAAVTNALMTTASWPVPHFSVVILASQRVSPKPAQ